MIYNNCNYYKMDLTIVNFYKINQTLINKTDKKKLIFINKKIINRRI